MNTTSLLHHTVTLAPGITQELSQMNTSMTHANTACHTVTETVQATVFDDCNYLIQAKTLKSCC